MIHNIAEEDPLLISQEKEKLIKKISQFISGSLTQSVPHSVSISGKLFSPPQKKKKRRPEISKQRTLREKLFSRTVNRGEKKGEKNNKRRHSERGRDFAQASIQEN